MGGKSLQEMLDARQLCGAFGQVCGRVVGQNESTRHVRDQAWEADNAANRAGRAVDQLGRGDLNGALINGGAALNSIGKLLN